jgi:hypothetical protein
MRIGTLKSLTVMIVLLGACSGCGTSAGANAALMPVIRVFDRLTAEDSRRSAGVARSQPGDAFPELVQ